MATKSSLLDRTFCWLIDRDGDLLGDEHERLRWYEAYSAIMMIQTIAILWVVAVAALLGDRSVAPALIAVLAALLIPYYLAVAYTQSKRVSFLVLRHQKRIEQHRELDETGSE
jgi:hypothetical protein